MRPSRTREERKNTPLYSEDGDLNAENRKQAELKKRKKC